MATKRVSSRTVVLSKAFKTVDAETRKEFAERRIQALEADNYIEHEVGTDDAADDEYKNEDEVNAHVLFISRTINYDLVIFLYQDEGKTQKKKRARAGTSAAKSKWLAQQLILEILILCSHCLIGLRATRKPKSLERVIFDEIADGGAGDRPNYESIAAQPSNTPHTKFCSVCGYIGSYSCTRCGQRFCSVRCNTSHKETRCLKFSL
jgi:hypothetical protein